MPKTKLAVLAVFLFFSISFAQEGMWMLNQIDKLDLKKKGLKMEVSDVYNKEKPALFNAIVQLGGGSASFVSPEGLIITNHHVAFTALQRASSTQNDYLTNGFLATNRGDEIKAPGYVARVLTEMRDVTALLNEAVKAGKTPIEQERLRQQKIAQLKTETEKGTEDIEATVAEMFNGKQFYLFVYKTFKDVRIVFAPPLAIGNYGGEVDNWMWPRHTGDFSFLRVYCSPNGVGKPFSPENVPYKPKVWLKVAKDALKEGDFTFIMGFPGFTTRYRTSTSVEWNLTKNYPESVKNFKEIIEVAETISKDNPEAKLKTADLVKGLANVMKNYEGKITAMTRTNFLQKKLDYEKEFMQWVNSDAKRKDKYASILSREKKEYETIAQYKDRNDILAGLQNYAGTQLSTAYLAYFVAKEKAKPADEQRPGFDEASIKEIVDGMQYSYANYCEPVDVALFIRAMKLCNALKGEQRIPAIDYVCNNSTRSIEQFITEAVKNSKLNDYAYASSLFSKTPAELEALRDPFMEIAVKIFPLSKESDEANAVFSINVTAIRKEYLDAIFEWKGMNMYPDANSTMRFTWGNIKGYNPADAVTYAPFTSLKGVVEKNTGVEPFNAPEKLISLFNTKDFGSWEDQKMKSVPVAFTHQCDITGGNSGSPVMNAKGEIIGVAFDGNYEGMISDWQYDYNLQRTISVDIRYVLFIAEKYAKADFLLKEMGVRK